MPQRRRQYRVRPKAASELSVSLVRPGRRPLAAGLFNLSAGGVSLKFDEQEDPLLVLRETVSLRIRSRHVQETLVMPCRVRRREKAPGGWLYALEFLDWLRFLKVLPPPLSRLFNQRSGPRVAVNAQNPIPVEVDCLPLKIKADLRDLSITGLSFQTPSNMETVFLGLSRLLVSFRLAGEPLPLEFHGWLIHQRLTERGLVCGVCFDSDRTPDFRRKQDLIARFIEECRRRSAAPVHQAQSTTSS